MKTFKKAKPNKIEEMKTPVAERLILPEHMKHIRLALYCNPKTNPKPYALELNITHDKARGGWDTDVVDMRNYPTKLANIRYKMPAQWRESTSEWYATAFDNASKFEEDNGSAFETLHAKMGARLGEAGNERYYNIAGVLASVHCSPEPTVLLQIADFNNDKGVFVDYVVNEFTLSNKKQFKVAHNIYWDNFDAE